MKNNKTRSRKSKMSYLTAFLKVDLCAEHAKPCIWCRRHGHFAFTYVNHNSKSMFSCISKPCASYKECKICWTKHRFLCFDKDKKLKTRVGKNRIVILYSVFEASTCERTLQNHAFGVGETATSRSTYVIYNSK